METEKENNKKEITMDELAGTVDGLVEMIDKLAGMMQQEFVAVQKRAEATNDKIDRVLIGQDQVLLRLENLETDNTAGAGASRRQNDQLENHEERIVVVEGKLGVGTV